MRNNKRCTPKSYKK